MPCDYSKYPGNWKSLRLQILERSDNKCEGIPKYPDCRAENYQPHPVTGSRVVLTIAHLDHDITHNNLSNLRALCQRCHLSYDSKHHANNARKTRKLKKESTNEHSG